jgi:hypothetical protein
MAKPDPSSVLYIADLFDLEGAVEVTESLTKKDYERVAGFVVKAYEEVDDVV